MNYRIRPTRLLIISLLALVTFAGTTSWAQTTYTWSATAGSNDWQAAASWSPNRTTLAGDDILVFNQGGNSTATNVPTQMIGKMQVSANTIITLQATNTSSF